VVWQSTNLGDYAQYDLSCSPLLAAGKLFIAAKSQANPQNQGLPQELVLAIQPHDGKVLWKTDVGTLRGQNQFYFWNYNPDTLPQPRLLYRAGAVYMDTQVGVIARLDADTGLLDWGHAYRTDPAQMQGRGFIIWGEAMPEPNTTGGSQLLSAADALLIKGMQSDRFYSLDPNRMQVLWDRPIAKSSRLIGADERAAYFGGPELSAVDLRTRDLLWATRVPSGSRTEQVLVRKDGIWQLTPRGIFEVDPKSGAVRHIFRGQDLGTIGGDLVLTDDWLVAVSNRTITAYPRRGGTRTAQTSHYQGERAFDE
jgi:outer membrane protein assembly factor BamB